MAYGSFMYVLYLIYRADRLPGEKNSREGVLDIVGLHCVYITRFNSVYSIHFRGPIMIFDACLILASVPSGTLLRKLFYQVFPSKPRLANAGKSIQRKGILFSSAVATVITLAIMFRPSYQFISALLVAGALCVGWRISVVGLTGGIATGKSTASSYIRDRLGCEVIDADVIARQVVRKGSAAFRQIVSQFGSEVVDPTTGDLNRAALGAIIFVDRLKKKQLERITHPRVLLEIIRRIIVSKLACRTVVIDVPLLFESKSPILYLLCFESLLIDAPVDIQSARLAARNPELSRMEMENRINSQLPREVKLKMADYVISNTGDVTALYRQLDQYFS